MRPARAVLAGVALLAALHAASFLGSGPVDDDFITFRYARNLVAGEGLVFNPGEVVEGFTAPLWLLILAGGLALGLSPEVLGPSLSILAAALAAFAVGRAWTRRYPGSRWPLPGLLVALAPAVAYHAIAGLGTTLLAALLALGFDLHDRSVRTHRPSVGAAVCLALACLLRQEAALFVPAYLWFEGRRRAGVHLLLPVLALVGWTAFRWFTFGRLLPMTYAVKKLDLTTDLHYGLEYLWTATRQSGVGVLLLAGLAVLRRPSGSGRPTAERDRDPALWALLVGVWCSALYVVYVGGDFMALGRFFVPTWPLMAFAACAGVRDLCTSRSLGPVWTRGAALLALAALQVGQLQRPQLRGEHRFFEERWALLGAHFAATVPADTRVALSPIGAFGWTSGLPIVDILGLTNASTEGREPDLAITMKGHHRYHPAWVLDQRPHFIVLANGVRQPDTGQLVINPWERDLYQHPRFRAEYVHMRAPIPGEESLDVFRRRDVPPLPGSFESP